MEFSSNRTSVVAIWASLVPTAVSGADVMGFGMCRSNNWTFAVIASKTLWALNVLVAGRSLSFTLVTMGNAFFACN